MHVRKESPSKSSTSADQFLKFGDAKKLYLHIDTNQRIQVIVASLLVVLSVPVKYIYVKLMPCSNTHALSLHRNCICKRSWALRVYRGRLYSALQVW